MLLPFPARRTLPPVELLASPTRHGIRRWPIGILCIVVSLAGLAACGRPTQVALPDRSADGPHANPHPRPSTIEIGRSLNGSPYLVAIERLSRRAGLSDLRRVGLGGDDLEIRVWTYLELAKNPLHGRIVRRMGGRSAAFEVRQPADAKARVRPTPLGFPKGGWIALFEGLAPLRTIRDESELPPDDVAVLDGSTTIVEVATPGTYRAVLHSNPEFHRSRPDALALVRATGLLDRAFPAR